MLKTKRGAIIGTASPTAFMAEAISVETAAGLADLGRSTLYKALHPHPGRRDGLPFLPSLKIGKTRRIRVEALRNWLAELEAASASEGA